MVLQAAAAASSSRQQQQLLFREAGQNFLDFINSTGSPYHSVLAARCLLDAAGFTRLPDAAAAPAAAEWGELKLGSKYYVTRNHSTIMAFIVGKQFGKKATKEQEQSEAAAATVGCCGSSSRFLITGAHTDSPCLRARHNCDFAIEGYQMLSVATYGGGLWHTWFDRGLGIAGKVVLRTQTSSSVPVAGIHEKLIRISRPIASIPNLAIHLQTAEERASFKFNPELHLRPILNSLAGAGAGAEAGPGTKELVASTAKDTDLTVVSDASQKAGGKDAFKRILAAEAKCSPDDILDYDICFMDACEGGFMGVNEEFIQTGRIDNISSTWASMAAICDVGEEAIAANSDVLIAIAWDHEEIGSVSFVGADGVVLEQWLQQIFTGIQKNKDISEHLHFPSLMRKSFLLSCDSAHGVHPNYPDKHQSLHKPMLGGGVVLKHNSSLRYASDGTTMAIIRRIAEIANCPLQKFAVRNDTPCGSTIGPLCSSRLGIPAIDLGISQWGMHSIRETCSPADLFYLKSLIKAFYSEFSKVASNSQYL